MIAIQNCQHDCKVQAMQASSRKKGIELRGAPKSALYLHKMHIQPGDSSVHSFAQVCTQCYALLSDAVCQHYVLQIFTHAVGCAQRGHPTQCPSAHLRYL